MASAKLRLDDFLVQAGWASDRKEAQALILAGDVKLRGHPAKAASPVSDPGDVQWRAAPRFVSRGGEKLHGAFEAFGISARDKICLDVGASTGGFTDCLLKQGAREVWAVDVGKGLMDQRLREDGRVHLLEEVNFRHFDKSLLAGRIIDLAVVDVSFISVDKILRPLRELLSTDADALILIKPQFEATPREAPGGFVRDEATRQSILGRTCPVVDAAGFILRGKHDARITGRGGNQETFFWLKRV